MANKWHIAAAAESEARLRDLGGLGPDDSLRAVLHAKALAAFAALLDGSALPVCSPEELAALARMLADNAERIAERQQLDEARRAA